LPSVLIPFSMANCLQNPDFCIGAPKPIVSDTVKFLGSFFLSTFLGFSILGVYLVVNHYPNNKIWLQPRMYRECVNKNGIITRERVLGMTVRDISALTDHQLMDYVGLDGVVFLLFIKSCIKICLFCTGFALMVLFPIYVTANDLYSDDDLMNVLTISNVEDGSWRLWFCVAAAFAFILASLYILYRDAGYVAKMVDRFLSQSHVSHYTVMVTDIPPQFRNQDNFRNLIETIYPEKIEKIHVIKDTKRIKRLTAELRACRRKLLEAIEHRNSRNQRLEIITSWRDCFPCPRYTDAIHHYNLLIRDLLIELNHAKSRPQYSGTAFVQFKDLVTTSCCVSTQIFANTLHFKCALAPYPGDLKTEHLPSTNSDHFWSQTLINLIILAIISVWVFLINSSVMLTNIESFVNYFYGIYAKENLHFLPHSFIVLVTSIIPTLLIKLWLMLLPIALRRTYDIFGVFQDAAMLNLKLMNKYYLCLIVMVLLSLVIVQTVSSSLDHVIRSITNLFTTMAIAMSKTSTLFIQYMMITALILDPIELFYPFQNHFLFSCLRRWWDEDYFRQFDYVYFFANLSLELIITVTYSVCSPMILFFSLMHFLMASLIFKHMLITYYDASCSLGRFIWIDLLQNVLYGLLVPIMTLIGLVIMKQAYSAAILLIVLLSFVLQIQQSMHVNTKMSSAFKCVCLQTAAKMDTENQFHELIRSEYASSHEAGSVTESNAATELSFERVYVPAYSECDSECASLAHSN